MAEAFWRDLVETFGEDGNRLRMAVGVLKELQLKFHSKQSRYVPPVTPEGEVDTDARELEHAMAMASAKGDG
jgi:hypothetical protein